jgi:hypothetical protein
MGERRNRPGESVVRWPGRRRCSRGRRHDAARQPRPQVIRRPVSAGNQSSVQSGTLVRHLTGPRGHTCRTGGSGVGRARAVRSRPLTMAGTRRAGGGSPGAARSGLSGANSASLRGGPEPEAKPRRVPGLRSPARKRPPLFPSIDRVSPYAARPRQARACRGREETVRRRARASCPCSRAAAGLARPGGSDLLAPR